MRAKTCLESVGRGILIMACAASVACGDKEPADDSSTSGTGATAGIGFPTTAGMVAAGTVAAGTVAAGAGGTTAGTGTDAGPIGPGTCALGESHLRKTYVELGSTVVNDENEAALHPVVISALASGGSRVAFMGDDGKLHIATLDENDKLFGTPFTLDASSFADMYADEAGGVVLVSRAAQGAGEKHCGTLENLCGNVSSLPAQYECRDMYLVRFNGPAEKWAVNLTDSSATLPPYLPSPTDAQRAVYIWEAYAHHGRIAYDGSRYAAYFGAAISVSETCVQPDSTLDTAVNIHQGDRMQVVDKNGALLDDAGGFGWGCSHSGYERVAWDSAASRFVAVCKTDNQNRIAVAPHYATLKDVDLAANNLSDLVVTPTGNWLAYSDKETAGDGNADVHLMRFSVSSDDMATVAKEVPVAMQAGLNERAPQLASYGEGGLLVAWETSTATGDLAADDPERKLYVQARDSYSGDAMGDAVLVGGIRGNRYHSLRTFPDGSVAIVAKGHTATSVMIVRVLPCAE